MAAYRQTAARMLRGQCYRETTAWRGERTEKQRDSLHVQGYFVHAVGKIYMRKCGFLDGVVYKLTDVGAVRLFIVC